MLTLTAAACALLLTDFIRMKDPGLVIGEAARTEVKAPFTFSFPDESATRHLQDEAADKVPLVYDHDALLRNRLQERVAASFAAGRTAYLAASLAQMAEGEETRSDEQEPVEAAAGEELPGEVIAQLGQDFVAELGLSLSPDEVQTIVRSGFDESIEDLAKEWLGEGMRDMVVTDRSVLPVESRDLTIVRQGFDGPSEETLRDLTRIRTAETARKDVAYRVLGANGEHPPAYIEAAEAIARAGVRGNLTYNEAETELRRDTARDGITPVVLTVAKGTTLVREGDVTSEQQFELVETMQVVRGEKKVWTVTGSLFVFCVLLFVSVTLFARGYIKKFSSRPRDIEAAGLLLLLIMVLARLVVEISAPVAAAASIDISPNTLWFLVPAAGAALLVRILINSETALVFTLVTSLLLGMLMGQSALFAAYFVVSSVTAASAIGKKRERKAILRAGVFTGVVNAAFVLVVGLVQLNLVDAAGGGNEVTPHWDALFAFMGGVISAFLVLGLVPLFELTGFDTDLKLLELGNLDHPLLRNLMLRAPGSYHHSVMVGTLAEASAEAIGANALQARVCAYFHDIGKAVRPQYFVENQRDGINRHSRLTPHQSARVIIDHVRDGKAIAIKHQLPKPIIDQIVMHHGTGLVHYFYAQAKAKDPNVDPNDFRYPGPKPNTREAGIVMLADKVEAACRSIREPNPENVSGMIQKIINSVMAEGQFDEVPLTVKELVVIAQTLKETVLAIHHHRIEYPEPPGGEASGGSPGREVSLDEPATSDPVITLEIATPDYESPEYLPAQEEGGSPGRPRRGLDGK